MAANRRRVILTPRGAILALVLGAMLFTSAYPLRRFVGFRHTIRALRVEDAKLDRHMIDLQRQKAVLETDGEVERIARENLGMVRPGEEAFVVVKPGGEPPRTTTAYAEPGARAGEPLLSRWWSAMKRAARALA